MNNGNTQEQMENQDSDILFDYRIRIEVEEPMHSSEPDDFVTDFKLTLLHCRDGEYEDWQEVGYLLAYRVRVDEAYAANENLYDVFDAHSDEMEEFANAIFEDKYWDLKDDVVDEFGVFGTDIFAIHVCVIDPAHRGHKLGWHMMKKAIDLLAGGCDLVLCKPHPLGSADVGPCTFPKEWLVDKDTLTQEKWQKFWQGLGFRQVGTSKVYALAPNVQSDRPLLLDQLEPQ